MGGTKCHTIPNKLFSTKITRRNPDSFREISRGKGSPVILDGFAKLLKIVVAAFKKSYDVSERNSRKTMLCRCVYSSEKF
jgi:hypothetical protein